jgi:putative protease
VRGCKVYVTLNTLVSDREMADALKCAKLASDCGVDGVIVQDLGLVSVLRRALPDLPLHASTQMSVHNLAGVQAAAAATIEPKPHIFFTVFIVGG